MAWRQALSQVRASPGEDPPLNQLSETLPWGGRGAKEPVRHARPFSLSCVPSLLGLHKQNQRSAVSTCSITHILRRETRPSADRVHWPTTIGDRAIMGRTLSSSYTGWTPARPARRRL